MVYKSSKIAQNHIDSIENKEIPSSEATYSHSILSFFNSSFGKMIKTLCLLLLIAISVSGTFEKNEVIFIGTYININLNYPLNVNIGASIKRPQLDGRIVGGFPIDIKQVPWQASLQRNGNHSCGASIISENWLLTAAHCTGLP